MKNRTQPLAISIEEDSSFPSPHKQSTSYFAHRLSSNGPPDSEEQKMKLEQSVIVGHVVEFEQFVPEEEREIEREEKMLHYSSVSSWYDNEQKDKGKKKFLIHIPDSVSSGLNNKKQDCELQSTKIKEPPAPSNKKNNKGRAFLFPTPLPSKEENKQQYIIQMKKSAINLVKNFEKERQQFYKQKSRLEKDLLIKQGQIQILQKTLTTLVGGDPQNFLNQCSPRLNENTKIAEKDRQIQLLLNRISQLNQQLSVRGEELVRFKNECTKLTHLNETLSNQIYLFENRNNSQHYMQPQFSLPTQHTSNLNDKSKAGNVINQLFQRVEMLTQNRKQIQENDKTKSSSFYSKYSNLSNIVGRQNLEFPKVGLGYYQRN